MWSWSWLREIGSGQEEGQGLNVLLLPAHTLSLPHLIFVDCFLQPIPKAVTSYKLCAEKQGENNPVNPSFANEGQNVERYNESRGLPWKAGRQT
jgi:hypothetical protein